MQAQALLLLGSPKEAYELLTRLGQQGWRDDAVVKNSLAEAEKLMRKETRPKYYELLGVPSVAAENEIKVYAHIRIPSVDSLRKSLLLTNEIKLAYKGKALVHHPDKGGDVEVFKLLGEALEILCEPMQRKLYDEGYDKQAIEQRVAAAKRAAHSHDGHGHH